ncbi:MAG: hypothetical protein KBS41_01190 [Oscillospiraceae bacterium]|nr:hypothetical protein [Candidatus Equicaccousia limihippi]
MKYPIISKPDLKRATVYDLSGGLNLSKDPRLLATNEQSDMKNVWFVDGELKARPELSSADSLEGYHFCGVVNDGQALFIKEIYRSYEAVYDFALVDTNGNAVELNTLTVDNFHRPDNSAAVTPKRCFAFCFNGEIYLAIAFHHVNTDTFYKGIFYRLCGDTFTQIQDDEIYAPLIVINSKGDSYSTLPASDNTVFSPACTFEGFNLLTDRVRVRCTTDGVSSAFKLPVQAQENQNIKVRIVASFNNGTLGEYTGEITPSSAATLGSSGIKCYLTSQNQIKFTNSSGTAMAPSCALASGNLEIEYHAVLDEGREEELFYCSLYSAFGASGGLDKGNRLFLSGSEKRPNKLFFSDTDNPLYFPENNYSMVGDGSILALQKQNDMLVIMLNNAIYYATYVGAQISASDIISGAVTDVTAAQAIFPLTLLDGDTGIWGKNCSMSVGGKVVFFGSDKAIYRINGKGGIVRLSDKIAPLLNRMEGEFFIAKVKCGFMLIGGQSAAVFNTDTNGWYIWEFENEISGTASFDRSCVIYDGEKLYVLGNTPCKDAYFTSPLFSFGYPDIGKKICEISLDGNAESVGFFTPTGETLQKPLLLNKKAIAQISGVKYAGFSVYGLLNAGSITLKYYIYNN